MPISRALMIGGMLAAAAAPTMAAEPENLTPVRFTTTVADDLRGYLYAQKVGWFREAGLEVTLAPGATGAIVAQSIIGGADDIGKSSITSIIAAYARGLAFAVIAPGLSYRKEEPTAGILVAANSPLKTVLDLQGKVVSCSAIGDIAYLGLRSLIDSHGGDSSTVKWVELPFPAVSAAIQSGRVDAGLMGEPAMMQDIRAGKIRYFVDELTGYSRPILEVVLLYARLRDEEPRDGGELYQSNRASGGLLEHAHRRNDSALVAADRNGSQDRHRDAPRLQRYELQRRRHPAGHRSDGEI